MIFRNIISKIGGVTVHVRDIKKAIKFYRDVLGLPLTRYDKKNNYAEFATAPVVLGLHVGTPEEKGREPGGATGISFQVRNIDETVNDLKARKIKITSPEDQGWALVAELYDPDDNIYLIYQEKE